MIYQYLAPWVPYFQQAISQQLHVDDSVPFIPMQLATIDSNTGFPQVRTVVYRGFLFDDTTTNVLTCTTDKRMAKYTQLLANDAFEIVCYFPTLKKQFRFSGVARLVDSEHFPEIDLPVTKTSFHSSDEEEDDEHEVEEEKEDLLELKVNSTNTPRKRSDNKSHPKLIYPVVSPSLLTTLKGNEDSYTNLSSLTCYPPTKEDWSNEVERQWSSLSKSLKKSFRKPPPLSEMDDAKLKSIDSINRGVDGKKEEDGYKNFAVVSFFVESVDFVDLDKDRRYIYKKNGTGLWSETEVCP
jgi:hypothetical protein